MVEEHGKMGIFSDNVARLWKGGGLRRRVVAGE
jgi:hypothetical protein